MGDPLSITASVVAILQLTGKVLSYLYDVHDVSKDLEHCAVELSNTQGLLIKLKSRLQGDVAGQPWFDAAKDLESKGGPLDQYGVALRMLEQGLRRETTFKKVKNIVLWKFKKEQISTIFGRIDRLQSVIRFALEDDHFTLARAIKDAIEMNRADIGTVQINTTNLLVDTGEIKWNAGALLQNSQGIRGDTRAILKEGKSVKSDTKYLRTGNRQIKQTTKILLAADAQREIDASIQWISSSTYPSTYSDLISRKQSGTGEWFLNHKLLQSWLRNPSSVLYCPGIPGAGKTIMAATVVEFLSRAYSDDPEVGICYLFCNYQVSETCLSLLAALVKQLGQLRPMFSESIVRLYQDHFRHQTRPSEDQICSTLYDILAELSLTYIVIDALDECSNVDGARAQLLHRLLGAQKRADVRLLLTSRFNRDIERELAGRPQLVVQANAADVSKYIQGQMQRLPRFLRSNLDLQRHVEETIVGKVDGMFLLAELYINSLHGLKNPKSLRRALDGLSNAQGNAAQSYDKAYTEAFRRIDAQSSDFRELARDTLSWLTYAKRQLTVPELLHALAVEPSESSLDSDNLCDLSDIIEACAGLVTVDPDSNVIRLVHHTTQQFLNRFRRDLLPKAPEQVAKACLNYLMLFPFRAGPSPNDSDLASRRENFPFFQYAQEYWSQHAVSAGQDVADLVFKLLRNRFGIVAAIQMGRSFLWWEDFQATLSHITILHVLANFKPLDIGQDLLDQSLGKYTDSVNQMDTFCRPPLFCAATNGNVGLTRWLLRNHSEIDHQSIYVPTALISASRMGHDEVVQLLLSNGASVSLRSTCGTHEMTALHQAVDNDHEQIVHLLLNAGADPNVPFRSSRTPLLEAVSRGQAGMVAILLRKGADANIQTNQKDTALHSAANRGDVQIVSLLLDAGAQMDARDMFNNTALHLASGAHPSIVRLLLDKGASVNTETKYGESPLSRAVAHGNADCVRLLLNHGADGVSEALADAAAEGHDEIVQEILEKHPEVEEKDSLVRALARGHDDIVRILIRRKLEQVESTTREEPTNEESELMRLGRRVHDEIVPPKNGSDLDHWPDGFDSDRWPDEFHSDIRTQIHASVDHMEVLLEQDSSSSSSSSSSDLANVQWLLKDIDIDIDIVNESILEAAVLGRSQEKVEFILDRIEADVDIIPALSVAARMDDCRTFRLLLERCPTVSLLDAFAIATDRIAHICFEMCVQRGLVNILGSQLLCLATFLQEQADFRLLIEHHADPNTPIHGFFTWIKRFLESGDDLIEVSPDDFTALGVEMFPLGAAAFNDDVTFMHMLLEAGADVSLQGECAFLYAYIARSKQALVFLLYQGVDYSSIILPYEEKGLSPAAGGTSLCKQITSPSGPTSARRNGLLEDAFEQGEWDVAELLLRFGWSNHIRRRHSFPFQRQEDAGLKDIFAINGPQQIDPPTPLLVRRASLNATS